jgi:hypothetical protein
MAVFSILWTRRNSNNTKYCFLEVHVEFRGLFVRLLFGLWYWFGFLHSNLLDYHDFLHAYFLNRE